MSQTVDEKAVHYQGVTIGIPTFGKISDTFMISQLTMSIPIFTNLGYHTVRGRPVDAARNIIANSAMKTHAGFVFFRDDDTLAPRDALNKMLGRLPIPEKTHPKENGSTVIGGVVYAKSQPPYPMIHIEGHSAGYEDWEVGDLVECDITGMGCTLIPIGVLYKMLSFVKTWQCVNDICAANENHISKKELEKNNGKCSSCAQELIPMFFKTVKDLDDDGKPCTLTEDSYFCLMAKKAGCKVFVDTGVQCRHEDFHPDPRQSINYYYNEQLRMPVWQQGEFVYFWPDPEQSATMKKKALEEVADKKKKVSKNGKVRFNLGSGPMKKKGFVNVDLNTDCDFKCDVRDIRPLLKEYGQADEIFASHVLEHIYRDAVLPTFRGWIKALKPGGVLNVEVPDAIWAAENFIKYATNGKPLDDFPQAIIYGAQRYPGDEHKTGIYEKRVKAMLSACRNLIKESKIEVVPEGKKSGLNQQVLRVKVVKK